MQEKKYHAASKVAEDQLQILPIDLQKASSGYQSIWCCKRTDLIEWACKICVLWSSDCDFRLDRGLQDGAYVQVCSGLVRINLH